MSSNSPTLEQFRSAYSQSQIAKSNDSSITSPIHLLAYQQRNSLRSNAGVDCDVFLFGRGEAPRRDMTKIGGLPYRPRDAAWPSSASGLMTFLGQISFMESQDLVGPTPGDVLLIFADKEWFEELVFEWQTLGHGDFVTAAEVPVQAAWEFVNCYGNRYRVRESVSDPLRATKIGGEIPWLQGGLHARSGGAATNVPGRFLGTLGSIQAAANCPFPWINHESALSYALRDSASEMLNMCDMGMIYLFLQDDGTVLWDFET